MSKSSGTSTTTAQVYFFHTALSVNTISDTSEFNEKTRRCELVWSTATCLKLDTKCPARSRLRVMISAAKRASSTKFCKSERRKPPSIFCANSLTRCSSVLATVKPLPIGVLSSCDTPATKAPSAANFSDCTNWSLASCKVSRVCDSSRLVALNSAVRSMTRDSNSALSVSILRRDSSRSVMSM